MNKITKNIVKSSLDSILLQKEKGLKFYAFSMHNMCKEDIENIKKQKKNKECLEFRSSNNVSHYYNVEYYAPEENLVVLEFKYSDNDAYSDKVYNSNIQELEENPREPEQKELNKQFFVVLQIHGEERYTLHISSTRRIAFANSFFASICRNPQVKIDKVFIDLDKLIDESSNIKKIGLNKNSSNDLINQGYKAISSNFSNSQYDVLINLEGAISPKDVKCFKKNNSSFGITSLSGVDNKGFDYFYNLKNFSKTFAANVEKKDDNLYSITDIYREAKRYLHEVLGNV